MKKRKTYEISVIDKTYSKIISDETKFYTSDTALELVFKLKETEYNFESAEIVLLNIDDRSLATRPVTKSVEGFTYELDDDITAHYGEWRGQLRFEQAMEIYVSSPVKFRIENDLSNDRPPQLSDVQSWVSLKRYADSLTEELKQAVMDVEGIEDTFNANELKRQTTFEKAETEREKGESIRVETFQTNETVRQSQFETAEQSRQDTFETNESERNATFNTNEATRQENETTRQQAESQRQSTFETNETERQTTFETAEQERQSAEIIRVENEKQRVLTYDNLQDTIDMIGKVKLTNSFENGDFSKGDVGWMNYEAYQNRFKVVDGVARNIETSTANHRSFIYTNSTVPIRHITYHAFRYKQTGVTSSRIGVLYGLSGVDLQQYIYPTGEDFKLYSGMGVSTGNEKMRVYISNIVADGEYSVYLDYFLILDLTDIFGAGNEPSKEVMDWIVKNNGYFDELTLRRDDIQQYEINQLRKAVLELGGNL